MADRITIKDKGDRQRLLAEHAVIIVGLDDNGRPVGMKARSDGTLSGSATPAIASANFVRPANTTAYTVGDIIANDTVAGNVVPLSLSVGRLNDAPLRIRRVRLKKSGASIANATFRVHFYRQLPTVTNGDNGVFLSTESEYLGYFDVAMGLAFSNAAKGVSTSAQFISAFPASGTQLLYALIEARDAYTPASGETFTLTVEVDQY